MKKTTVYMMANPEAYGTRIIPMQGWVLDDYPELAVVRPLPDKDGKTDNRHWELVCRDTGRCVRRGMYNESKYEIVKSADSKKAIDSYYKRRKSGKLDKMMAEHADAMREEGYEANERRTERGRKRPLREIGDYCVYDDTAKIFIKEMKSLGYDEIDFEVRKEAETAHDVTVYTSALPRFIPLMSVCLSYIEMCVVEGTIDVENYL